MKQTITKPKVILLYNRYKGGVDLMDKCTKTYSCQRKTRRWSLAVFLNMVDLCVHNSFLMFTAANPDWQANSNRKKAFFLKWLAKELAIEYVRQRQSVTKLHKKRKGSNSSFYS